MVFLYIFSLTFVLSACGGETEETTDVIASEAQLFDLTITQSDPENYDHSDETVEIGIVDDIETRMLIQFPAFMSLYDEDVVVSSIANLELEMLSDEIQVNPSNIRLYFLSQPWTPFATWNSRFSIGEGFEWTNSGGDFHSISYVNPDLEKLGPDVKLTFNLTQGVLQSIENDLQIYGFAITVNSDAINGSNTMTIYTGNSNAAPTAVLTFNNREVLNP